MADETLIKTLATRLQKAIPGQTFTVTKFPSLCSALTRYARDLESIALDYHTYISSTREDERRVAVQYIEPKLGQVKSAFAAMDDEYKKLIAQVNTDDDVEQAGINYWTGVLNYVNQTMDGGLIDPHTGNFIGKYSANDKNKLIAVKLGPVILNNRGMSEPREVNVDLGNMFIVINLRLFLEYIRGGNQDYLLQTMAVFAEAPVKAIGTHYYHPHVATEGKICYGEGARPCVTALNSYRINDAFDIVRSLLNTYNNGSPYVRLSEWLGVTCEACKINNNPNEARECRACRSSFCASCTTACARGCGSRYCKSCVDTANQSGIKCESCNRTLICNHCDGVTKTHDYSETEKKMVLSGRSSCKSCISYCARCNCAVPKGQLHIRALICKACWHITKESLEQIKTRLDNYKTKISEEVVLNVDEINNALPDSPAITSNQTEQIMVGGVQEASDISF